MSKEQKEFLRKYKLDKRITILFQVMIVVLLIVSWELLSKYNVINPFIFSSPSKVI